MTCTYSFLCSIKKCFFKTRLYYFNVLQHSCCKTVSPQEKVRVVVLFIEFKSATQVQLKFQSPPSRPTIYEWHEKFMMTGSVLPKPKSGCSSGSFDEVKTNVRHFFFFCNPRKSIHSVVYHLQIPRSTVHDVVHKKLQLHAYKLQLLCELKPDKPRCRTFAEEMFRKNRG